MLHIIQCGVSRSRVTAHAMLITVIIDRAMGTHNGDRHINRVNLLVTVRHVERHRAEVRVRVGKLVQLPGIGTLQAHVRSTGIGALGGDDTIHQGGIRGRCEGKVTGHIVQSGVSRGRVARHRMLLTVIVGGIVGTDNRNDNINRVDLLVTVGHVEGHRAEVGVRVGELVRCTGITTLQTHVRGTGIGAFGGDDTVHQGRIRSRREGEVDVVTRHLVQAGA